MTTDSTITNTTGDYPLTTGGYYDLYGSWMPYSVPYWNPPVYIQPTYVVPPQTVIFYPDTELKEEVKELKEEIRKLRKQLAKGV